MENNKLKFTEELRSGELHYKDVVYVCIGSGQLFDYVFTEERSRFHSINELRYQVKAWFAEKVLSPDLVFEKREHIADSGWKKHPQECRQKIAENAGFEFGEVVAEDTIG